MTPAVRHAIRWLAGVAVAGGSLWFMGSQLSIGFARVSDEMARLPGWTLAAAGACFAASAVAECLIWHRVLRTLPGHGGTLSLLDTFAVLNVSAVGKYLPGKVWGYAWQMFLLDRRGVPVRASLWTNAVVILASCAAGALVGGAAAAVGGLPAGLVLLSLAAGLVLAAVMPMHQRVRLIQLIESRLRIDLSYAGLDLPRWGLAVAGYCAVWAIYGAGGALLAIGLRPELGGGVAAGVVAGMCLSWLAGAVVFITPAGLGVREAALALALSKLPGGLGAVLPVASRILLIAVDLLLEALALLLLWSRRPRGAEVRVR